MTSQLKPRMVPCPSCKGPSRYATDNPFRPFCNERCRDIDLGAWASERFRVEAEPPAENDESSGAREPPH